MICPNCESTAKQKDHGSWVGWYCPSCKSGGSFNKQASERNQIRNSIRQKQIARETMRHGWRVTFKTKNSEWTKNCWTENEAKNEANNARIKYKATTTIEKF